jgi:hypothetical protein
MNDCNHAPTRRSNEGGGDPQPSLSECPIVALAGSERSFETMTEVGSKADAASGVNPLHH